MVYVTEIAGTLKVRTSAFGSRPLGAAGIRLENGVLWVDGGRFARRDVASGTFRIEPVRPVEQLRPLALAATPPVQPDTLRAPDLVELRSLDATIKYDIRYATTNNFMNAVFYTQPRAFLQRPAAEAVVRAHRKLRGLGYGLLIHDAYRPWHVTKMFWDATPDSLKDFVADPRYGSRHNRGAAVDLTLYDLATGTPVEMPSGYDEFSIRAYPEYPGGTARQRWHRDLLRRVMEAEGFRVYQVEWWHFDYEDWRSYPVLNRRFEELGV
jgi:D-alanyl-D-alanine dipeptidase